MNSQANIGIGGMAFQEMQLKQKPTDLHAKLLMETSLRYGKTATYTVPSSKLDSNVVEINFPSMDQTPAHSEFSSALRNAILRWYNTYIIFVIFDFTS